MAISNDGARERFRQSVAQDEVLRGSVQAEYRTCGKPTCHCASGALHGPYLYRRWRDGGRQRRAYVKATELEAVREAIAAYHRLYPRSGRPGVP